jgi:hypothetical protein
MSIAPQPIHHVGLVVRDLDRSTYHPQAERDAASGECPRTRPSLDQIEARLT